MSTLEVNSLVNQRYLLKQDGIFLDTKPGLVPESPSDLPAFLTAYLRLSAYPLHVPRVYSAMKTPEGDYLTLLESSALAAIAKESQATAAGHSTGEVPQLLPKLSDRWTAAPPLRQLNWLWQIAQLWEPFSQEQVAATLLDEHLLRVDGSIVRLLALASDSDGASGNMSSDVSGDAVGRLRQPPTLIALGIRWRSLAENSHQAVRTFLERLCEQLERQQLSAEQLCERLSSAITVCEQGQAVDYHLTVRTDQGPTRKRNEDACYPESGTAVSASAEQTRTQPQLLIVCDGIGGHQGGDVASKLAIETIRTQLAPVMSARASQPGSAEMALEIEKAICAANDEISAQNDRAQRQARDRMGTTLVLALVEGANVYIAHLGDSRAYRISGQNCQQVTLDDDVASRQVRLAGGLYRDALTQPGSGSLIQALGMGSSQTLRPTVQRFVVDEDCLFLLCSDGLSDSDRVEQLWPSVLRPLVASTVTDTVAGTVAGTAAIEATGQQLVDLANKYNGHDNVTVGLVSARVALSSDRMVPRELAIKEIKTTSESADETLSTPLTKRPSKRHKTSLQSLEAAQSGPSTAQLAPISGRQFIADRTDRADRASTQSFEKPIKPSPTERFGFSKALLAFLALAGIGGLLYVLFVNNNYRFGAPVTSSSGGLEALEENAENASAPASSNPVELPAELPVELVEGAYVRIRPSGSAPAGSSPLPEAAKDNAAASGSTATPGISDTAMLPAERATQILLYPNAEDGSAVNALPYTIPVGAVAQIEALKQVGSKQWAQLAVCTIPSGDLSSVPTEGAASDNATADPGAPLKSKGVSLLSPGASGWALSSSVERFAWGIDNLGPDQRGRCEG